MQYNLWFFNLDICWTL